MTEAKTESRELVIPSPKGKEVVYSPEFVNVIKNTVAKEATDEELFMFLSIAQKYGLDPFAKEIWFIKYKNKRTGEYEHRIETARDGYLTIAKRDPDFQGIQSFAVHENDTFEMEVEQGEVKNVVHKFSHKDRGHLLGGWAVAKHLTKENVYEYLPFKEARQNTPNWQSHPTLMMKKVVESAVLKRMAGITGLVTAEEMGTDTIRYVENPNHGKPLSSANNNNGKPKSSLPPSDSENDVQDADFQVKTQTTTKSDEASTEAEVDEEPETHDMSGVDLDNLKGINKNLDSWIKTCQDKNELKTIKQVCGWCEGLLDDKKLTLKEFNTVKKALGMKVK